MAKLLALQLKHQSFQWIFSPDSALNGGNQGPSAPVVGRVKFFCVQLCASSHNLQMWKEGSIDLLYRCSNSGLGMLFGLPKSWAHNCENPSFTHVSICRPHILSSLIPGALSSPFPLCISLSKQNLQGRPKWRKQVKAGLFCWSRYGWELKVSPAFESRDGLLKIQQWLILSH